MEVPELLQGSFSDNIAGILQHLREGAPQGWIFAYDQHQRIGRYFRILHSIVLFLRTWKRSGYSGAEIASGSGEGIPSMRGAQASRITRGSGGASGTA